MERKNIHVLSSDLSKWKEKYSCVVFRLKKMERKNLPMCYFQAQGNGKKNFHVLSSDLSKWKEKTSLCCIQT